MQEHFMILVEMLESNGFIHYELSNFERNTIFLKQFSLLVRKNTSESVLLRIVTMVFEVGILLIILYFKAIDGDELQMKLKFYLKRIATMNIL
jgi:oxygen-independent coproporphyrinogen-3 oxidase